MTFVDRRPTLSLILQVKFCEVLVLLFYAGRNCSIMQQIAVLANVSFALCHGPGTGLPLTVWHRRPTGCMKWPGTFRLMSCNNIYTHAHKQGFIENGSGGGGGGGTRVQLTVFRGVICS